MKKIRNILIGLLSVILMIPIMSADQINNQSFTYDNQTYEYQLTPKSVRIDMSGKAVDPFSLVDYFIKTRNGVQRPLTRIVNEDVELVMQTHERYKIDEFSDGFSINCQPYLLYNHRNQQYYYCIEPTQPKIGQGSEHASPIWSSLSEDKRQLISKIIDQATKLAPKNYQYPIAGQLMIHNVLSKHQNLIVPPHIQPYINEINANLGSYDQKPSFDNTEQTMYYNEKNKRYEGQVVDTNGVLATTFNKIDGKTIKNINFKVQNNTLLFNTKNPLPDIVTLSATDDTCFKANTANIPQDYMTSDPYQDMVSRHPIENSYQLSFKTMEGSVNGTKVDDEHQPLAGVEFSLYFDENNNSQIDFDEPVIQTTKTNNQGQFSFNQLGMGRYIVKETKGLVGYYTPTYEEVVNITPQALIHTLNKSTPIVNELIKGDIIVNKTDENQKPLAGVEFQLIQDLEADGVINEEDQVLNTQLTDENGKITFNDNIYGNYLIRESKPLEGYLPDQTLYPIVIDEETSKEPQEINVVNYLEPDVPIEETPQERLIKEEPAPPTGVVSVAQNLIFVCLLVILGFSSKKLLKTLSTNQYC